MPAPETFGPVKRLDDVIKQSREVAERLEAAADRLEAAVDDIDRRRTLRRDNDDRTPRD